MFFHFCFCFFSWYSYGLISSSFGLKSCAITAGIKKYKSIIKKNKKNNVKILLLTKSKLNTIEVLNPKALIDLNLSHEEFVLINNVLKEFYEIKEELKSFNKK